VDAYYHCLAHLLHVVYYTVLFSICVILEGLYPSSQFSLNSVWLLD